MRLLFRQEFQRIGWAEPHTLRLSPTEVTLHKRFSVRIIGDGTEGTAHHAHPAARASVLIDRDRSGFAILLNAQRWAEINALRLITLLAGNHIKNEIVFLIYA